MTDLSWMRLIDGSTGVVQGPDGAAVISANGAVPLGR
jgi:hypothetical protein